jgi:tetratricopeptide (TPR) repeat protein
MAYVHYAARDYESAAREYRAVLDVDPKFFPSLTGLIETLAAHGLHDDALRMVAEAERRTGRGPDLSIAAAYVYALAGRRDDALRYLKQAEGRVETSNGSSADVASVYGVLGDKTRAFEWMARALDHGDTQLGYLGVDPRFDSLRADPRFDALMAAVGLSTR